MSNTILSSVKSFVRDVEKFNDIAGNLSSDKLNKESLLQQLALVNEELKETITAVETNDPVEMLDGVVDVLVTAFGFAQKLEAMGFNVGEAMHLVAQNNLEKYPTNIEDVAETLALYDDAGVECAYEFNSNHGMYVVKDSNGKVRKPIHYKSVDINHCAPVEI